jgi:hypothetical protein
MCVGGGEGVGLSCLGACRRSESIALLDFEINPVLVFQMAQYIQREVLNHKELCHPHIVAMKEVTMALAVDWPST